MSLISKDYMGLLVVNHYTSEEPVACIGAQLPSPAITEVALYRASMDTENNRVVKKDLLAKVRMTDAQFGNMIGRPNYNNGQEVTLEAFEDRRIVPMDNLAESQLIDTIDSALSPDSQIARFIRDMQNEANAANEKGKLNKGTLNSIQRTLGHLLSNLSANVRFRLDMVNEVASERTLEAQSSIHQMVRDSLRIGGQRLALPDLDNAAQETLPTSAFLKVSVAGSSSRNLFDDLNMHDNLVTLHFSSAKIAISTLGDDREPYYTDDISLASVHLSSGQYARFVRADRTEVPCTITRVLGKPSEPVPDSHTAKVEFSTSGIDEHYGNLVKQAESLIDALAANEIRGKGGINTLIQRLADMQTALLDDNEQAVNPKQNIMQSTISRQQERLVNFMETELLALPEEHRETARQTMKGLLSKTAQLTFKPENNKN